MTYGKHVSAFTFMTDLLGDEYLAIGRCDNFNRNYDPCKLEFFEVGRSRSNLDITSRDPGTAIRTPTGISSLAHDSNLDVSVVDGGYFHLSFDGMTPENIDRSAENDADQEVA